MRPVALNRKNALFAGSDEGAENWAMLASLIETCKLHGINPDAYLTDVLTKLVNNWPNRRLSELLPWSWTPASILIPQAPIATVQKLRLRQSPVASSRTAEILPDLMARRIDDRLRPDCGCSLRHRIVAHDAPPGAAGCMTARCVRARLVRARCRGEQPDPRRLHSRMQISGVSVPQAVPVAGCSGDWRCRRFGLGLGGMNLGRVSWQLVHSVKSRPLSARARRAPSPICRGGRPPTPPRKPYGRRW